MRAELLQRIGSRSSGGAESNPWISSLAYDSRQVAPGSLFFALPGLHADGHDFIPDALRRGAAAIIHQKEIPPVFPGNPPFIRVADSRFAMSPVADAFYQSPSNKLRVLGVTGTEGKSTTVYLIHQLLLLAGKKAGFLSTVQASDGETVQWNREHQTTPEAPAIHRLLHDMVGNGAEFAVLEASSHGLSPRTNRLGDVAFDCGVLTNVNHEHLEFHGTWEQYRSDKANLFRALGKTAKPLSGGSSSAAFGVVNGDDPSAAYFMQQTGCPVYRFSTHGAEADLSIKSMEAARDGNSYQLWDSIEGESLAVQDFLPGSFNGGNLLAALLVLSHCLGVPVRDLIPYVPLLKPVKGRMSPVQRGQPFEALVDYAHTPASFALLLPPLKERVSRQGGRLLCLFGSAGDRDRAKRAEQGRIAARSADIIILSDEDPRGEEPMDILEEIAQGVREENPEMAEGSTLFLLPNRKEAIRQALALAQPGDLALFLGKGHENSIIYRNHAMPFDEIGEVEQALAELGYAGG